ncbi:class I SAM-dependent methyltransferase (plasmid) [Thiothrix fructosivorans]|uniref:Class I SAM-dependent methyltransferase n=1 Tax=Thiothrix fructosivorans TaxID=111770 RepID=A0A8B0SNL5_9GAMM|nr:class I SAM-dependent methyltransferase [Thiothrix fructosivorans]MBO0611630.1 class I SAM-dependent methyltransferase [Thiothrix fructosivorans]QTX12916.1 class I SAM-dependent methyltransferase [Thiothrix fructosivorans]
MQIQNPTATTRCNELDLIAQHLPLDNATVLELGCGKAQMTRRIAERFPTVRIIATEVDQIQHANNLETQRSLNEVEGNPHPITFKLSGAQAIDAPDNSVDVVFMFKSLHHVPRELMAQSLQEIARVLKPGGLAWISEPVYAGDFNDILRLFHDEKVVRELAFQAVSDAVAAGTLELVEQIFCNTESRFADFNEFDQRIIQVTHTNHQLDDALYQTVKTRFNAHVVTNGAAFENPARFDVLRKPYCAL